MSQFQSIQRTKRGLHQRVSRRSQSDLTLLNLDGKVGETCAKMDKSVFLRKKRSQSEPSMIFLSVTSLGRTSGNYLKYWRIVYELLENFINYQRIFGRFLSFFVLLRSACVPAFSSELLNFQNWWKKLSLTWCLEILPMALVNLVLIDHLIFYWKLGVFVRVGFLGIPSKIMGNLRTQWIVSDLFAPQRLYNWNCNT